MSQILPLFVSVVTLWYWLSILRYWVVFGGTGCQCDMLSENMWFTWCKPSNYSIFGEGKSDDGQIDKKTDRQNFLSKLIEKEMQKTKKVSRCWWVGGWTPNRTSGQTSRPPPVTSHSPNKFWQYLKNRIYESTKITPRTKTYLSQRKKRTPKVGAQIGTMVSSWY